MFKLFILGIIFLLFSCKTEGNKEVTDAPTVQTNKRDTSKFKEEPSYQNNILEGWVKIISSQQIVLDIKYATSDNFTSTKIYDCSSCYLREDIGKAILAIAKELNDSLGYQLKIFDCYRPLSAQEKLWSKKPNPTYVTDPQKGSMHNRGMAVDLTIVDREGKELDMGSPYDYFGRESHIDNINFPKEILDNRALLFNLMDKYNLLGIRTEWWHYSMQKPYFGLSNWNWDC